MPVLDIVDTDVKKWDYLKEYVPGFDYHKVHSDYRSSNNIVGHIQRSVVIYWAVREHERTGGIGLEPGCGQATSPFCIGTDYYSGDVHPVYGGSYRPHVRCMGEVLPFKDGSFDFIVSHHSLEHMKDTENTMREWLRVLKAGGRIIIVMPDRNYGPFGDSSHVSECTPKEFYEIIKRISDIEIIEYNTLKNSFSFNAILEKKRQGDKMTNEILNKQDLREQMETLWHDRADLLSLMVLSIIEDDGELDTTYNQLLKNQEDIGNALKPFLEKFLFCWDDIPGKDEGKFIEYMIKKYSINWIQTDNVYVDKIRNAIMISSGGKNLITQLNSDRTKAVFELNLSGKNYEFGFDARSENGKLNIYQDIAESRNLLVTMLKNSITISKNLVKAQKANDVGASLESLSALKENAISISGFLSGYNPAWTHKTLETALFNQINSFKDEIVSRLGRNHDSNPAAHDNLIEQASKFADVLLDGIK